MLYSDLDPVKTQIFLFICLSFSTHENIINLLITPIDYIVFKFMNDSP